MKKNIRKLLGNSRGSRKLGGIRQLRHESLEGRQLLAADIAPFHNYLMAEDVNEDFRVSPLDALLVINALNAGGSRGFAEGEISSGLRDKLDVNRDNFLSPIDALSIINRLNAEGEDAPQTFISYSYEITDTAGLPLSGSRVVGETFRINVFARDVRPADARPISDPTDPNYSRFNGVFSAAQDLGVSDLDLVSLVTTTNFFSGVEFGEEFLNDQGVNEGGGIQIGGVETATVSDAQRFSLQTATGTATFEFDLERTAPVAAGNVAIPLRNPVPVVPTDPVNPLTFAEVSAAMITAIEGAGLGLSPTDPGAGVVGLDLDGVTFDPLNSSLSLSRVEEEYLNEVKAFLDRSRSPDPDGAILFYSADFTAQAPGLVVFNPNGPERPGSENLVFGSQAVIPNSMINFGGPIEVNIISDPSAPVAVNDSLSINEDTSLELGANILANDIVTAPRTLSIDSISAIPGVTLGTIIGTTYTPPADYFGPDSFRYVVRDSSGLISGIATVSVDVISVNDAPNAFDDLVSVEEDSADTVLSLLADNGNGADNAGPANEVGDTIQITGLGPTNATTITTANGGTVSIATGGTEILYTPAATFLGTDTFTYTITDGGGLTDTATVTVEVEPGVLPRARTDRATGEENTTVTVSVLANDSVTPNSTGTVLSFSQGASGSVTRQSEVDTEPGFNVLVYTPTDENFFGTDTFTYTINDSSGLGENSTATVTITISNVNDVPVLGNDSAATVEDTPATIAISTLLANDSPGAGEGVGEAQVPQTLTLTDVSALTAGGGTVAVVGTDVVYTPAPDFNGTFEFVYTATDNGTPALSGTATVTISVSAVNDAPIAGPDVYSTNEDSTLVISADPTAIVAGNVLFNDRPGPETAVDEASQTLSVTAVSPTSAQAGSVVLENGTITYRPFADFNGSDSFTYTLRDSEGGETTGTVTVNVAPVNDAPITNPNSVSGFRDVPLTILAATLAENDLPGPPDEASQTLTVVEVAATANTFGTVVLSNGFITYTANPGFTGEASFQYTVQDSAGGLANGTVNVSVAEFVPSSISGHVWLDDDGENDMDLIERRLGGMIVTLSGTSSQGQAIVPQTQITLADGSYSFDGLGPGNYSVSYSPPHFLRDNLAGPDTYSLPISDPRGTNATGRNFAVAALDLASFSAPQQTTYQLIVSQFSSGRRSGPPSTLATDVSNILGGYFAIGADNTQFWAALPAGSDPVVHSEVVLMGDRLLVTVVGADEVVSTVVLGSRDFVRIHDDNGNSLIAIVRVPTAFQAVNLSTPPFNANRYLDSVDAIFAQEGW